MMFTERIQKIIENCKYRGTHQPQDTFLYDLHHLSCHKYKGLEQWKRIAMSMADALKNQGIYVYPEDRIIGRVYYLNSKEPQDFDPEIRHKFTYTDKPLGETRRRIHEEFENYEELVKYRLVATNCAGHIAWDWNQMLKVGTTGMKERCYDAISRTSDEESIRFYKGVLILLEALEEWNDYHAEKLENMGMHEMAEIVRKVPRYPAETFHEAVQSFYMQYIMVMRENPYGGNSPGRLDYYLWPYLENDLKTGKCTLEEAKELIAELFLRIDERLYDDDGWVETIVVGGSDANGRSAVNPLSHIMIEVFMELNITHPAVYVRIPKNPPEDFVKLCARYIKDGGNRAQLLNDESIIKALNRTGVPYRDAVDYVCGGCMEIGLQGLTGDYLYNGWYSIVKIVELAVTGGVCLKTGNTVKGVNFKGVENFENFDDFYNEFIGEVKRLTNIFFRAQDIYSEEDEKARPSYLISSMIDDCMLKGRNMHGGGARYYDYGCTPIALPNAADYLFAVKKAIFDNKICTPNELVTALKSNFEGYEDLRKKLIDIPKYGQENEEADAMVVKLFSDVSEIFTSYVNRFGGRGKLVILTFVWAPEVGEMLGATAYGSFAGKPVAQGVTPQGAYMNKGITAAMNSCTTVPFEIFNGGASTMWDLDSDWATEDIIEALFTTFFENGGQIFQGNATDVESLLKAQENPEDYQSLIVRVGGYSARFINLTKDVQEDIITRFRHNK